MKILIVDDHTLIREALRNVIAELDPDATIFEAASRQESETLTDANPDIELVLLDLGLPDGEGMDLLSRLRAQFPTLAVIVMSGTKDQATVTKALGLGAQGFIPKSAARPVMLNALRLVIEGGIYIPPEALERSGATPSPSHSPSLPADSPQDLGLTERQIDVLALMMLGKSNKAICRDLNLAEATVKNHVTAILKAFNVTNRTEAVVAAGAKGWSLQAARGRER